MGLGVAVGVAVGSGVGVAVSWGTGVEVGSGGGVRAAVGVGMGSSVGLGVGSRVGEAIGAAVAVGSGVRICWTTSAVGGKVGVDVEVGETVAGGTTGVSCRAQAILTNATRSTTNKCTRIKAVYSPS